MPFPSNHSPLIISFIAFLALVYIQSTSSTLVDEYGSVVSDNNPQISEEEESSLEALQQDFSEYEEEEEEGGGSSEEEEEDDDEEVIFVGKQSGRSMTKPSEATVVTASDIACVKDILFCEGMKGLMKEEAGKVQESMAADDMMMGNIMKAAMSGNLNNFDASSKDLGFGGTEKESDEALFDASKWDPEMTTPKDKSTTEAEEKTTTSQPDTSTEEGKTTTPQPDTTESDEDIEDETTQQMT